MDDRATGAQLSGELWRCYLIAPDGTYSPAESVLETLSNLPTGVRNTPRDESALIGELIARGWVFAIDRGPQPMCNPSWVIRADQYTHAMVQTQIVPIYNNVICRPAFPDEKISWCDSIGDCQWLRTGDTDIRRLSDHFTMRPHSSALPKNIDRDVLERIRRVPGPLFHPCCGSGMALTLATFWHLVDEFHFAGMQGRLPWESSNSQTVGTPLIPNSDFQSIRGTPLPAGGWRYDFALKRPEGRALTVYCHERPPHDVLAELPRIGALICDESVPADPGKSQLLDAVLRKMGDGGIVVASDFRFTVEEAMPAELADKLQGITVTLPQHACCLGPLDDSCRRFVWRLGARW